MSTSAPVNNSASASSSVVSPGQVGGAAAIAPSNLPNEKVLAHAAKIAMEQDKPILLDYYKETREGKAFLGEDKDTKEKILVKSTEEYTSPVTKMFKAKDDYIVVTENSVYIVSGNMKKKEISSNSM
jgi:hypothetical protein